MHGSGGGWTGEAIYDSNSIEQQQQGERSTGPPHRNCGAHTRRGERRRPADARNAASAAVLSLVPGASVSLDSPVGLDLRHQASDALSEPTSPAQPMETSSDAGAIDAPLLIRSQSGSRARGIFMTERRAQSIRAAEERPAVAYHLLPFFLCPSVPTVVAGPLWFCRRGARAASEQVHSTELIPACSLNAWLNRVARDPRPAFARCFFATARASALPHSALHRSLLCITLCVAARS